MTQNIESATTVSTQMIESGHYHHEPELAVGPSEEQALSFGAQVSGEKLSPVKEGKLASNDNPSADRVERFVVAIKKHWQKATEGIFEVSRLCAEANRELTPVEKTHLRSALGFSLSTFSKLAAIGNDSRLQKQEIREMLPPHLSTIYEVSKLDDKQFDDAVSNGQLSPSLKRSEVAALSKSESKTTNALLAEVRLPENAPPDDVRKLMTALRLLKDKFDFELIGPTDTPRFRRLQAAADKAINRAWARFHDRMFSGAKRAIARQLRPHRKDKSGLQMGLYEEERTITREDSEAHVRYVLGNVHLENTYDALHSKAMKELKRSPNPALAKLGAIPFVDCDGEEPYGPELPFPLWKAASPHSSKQWKLE